MSLSEAPPAPALSRNTAIALGVVAFHVAALWAIQSGLLRKAVEVVLPAEIVVELLEPPRVSPPPPPPAPPPPKQKPVVQPKAPTPPPAPMPIAIADPTPAPAAPVGVIQPPAPTPAPPAPAAPPAAPPAPPAAPAVSELSAAEVTYLTPPRPVYPGMSRRLNETGNVIVSVYFDVSGVPKRAEVFKSSGFERLDRAAVAAMMAARVTPLRRPGVTESHIFMLKAPINFVLE